jgi:hypothetical protein
MKVARVRHEPEGGTMTTADDAFREGMRLARVAMGLPRGGTDIRGSDAAVIAAHSAFCSRAAGKEDDPRFAEQGPAYAKSLIIRAYAAG